METCKLLWHTRACILFRVGMDCMEEGVWCVQVLSSSVYVENSLPRAKSIYLLSSQTQSIFYSP